MVFVGRTYIVFSSFEFILYPLYRTTTATQRQVRTFDTLRRCNRVGTVEVTIKLCLVDVGQITFGVEPADSTFFVADILPTLIHVTFGIDRQGIAVADSTLRMRRILIHQP